jgi:hypothetical protein
MLEPLSFSDFVKTLARGKAVWFFLAVLVFDALTSYFRLGRQIGPQLVISSIDFIALLILNALIHASASAYVGLRTLEPGKAITVFISSTLKLLVVLFPFALIFGGILIFLKPLHIDNHRLMVYCLTPLGAVGLCLEGLGNCLAISRASSENIIGRTYRMATQYFRIFLPVFALLISIIFLRFVIWIAVGSPSDPNKMNYHFVTDFLVSLFTSIVAPYLFMIRLKELPAV